MRKSAIFLFISLFCLWLSAMAVSGPVRQQRQPSDKRVELLHADCLYFNVHVHPTAQFLVGDVRFNHDGTLMFCDSALFYQETNSFDAFGHVRMKQADTLSLTGEVLYYDGLDQMARMRHNVVLKHRQSTLYTDSLDYDRLFGLGYFFDGGRLIDKDNELTSDWGEYCPSTRQAKFNYNVKLVNPRPPKEAKSTLVTDTLHYNTATGLAHALGPSNIDNGDNHIYSEDAVYNTNTDKSYLLNRSMLQNGYRNLVGDSVCWDAKTKIGKAFGHAIYTDTLNRNKFVGNYAMYEDLTGYAEAADSAMLIDYSQRDTLYAHADSFFLYTYNINTDSVYRKLHAYHHVRAYRVDVQAVCDSMVYDGSDSCATMYKDPIIWQQGQQLLGEKIKIWTNDSTIDSVYVINQALSVERIDSTHYNQIASNEMHSYFEGGVLQLTVADKNVFLNYYPFDDDSLMIGMNHTESSEMRMFMKERKVDKIWMPAATGTMYPLIMIPPTELYLENFAWFDYVRPKDKEDVYHWRPKKAGTELKESVQHEAKKQSLKDIKKNRKQGKDGNVSDKRAEKVSQD